MGGNRGRRPNVQAQEERPSIKGVLDNGKKVISGPNEMKNLLKERSRTLPNRAAEAHEHTMVFGEKGVPSSRVMMVNHIEAGKAIENTSLFEISNQGTSSQAPLYAHTSDPPDINLEMEMDDEELEGEGDAGELSGDDKFFLNEENNLEVVSDHNV